MTNRARQNVDDMADTVRSLFSTELGGTVYRVDVVVSSDPHAWLRPIYRQLAADRSFSLVSVETQFSLLVEAAAVQSEHQAALLREYNHATRVALLSHLSKMEQERPGPRQVEMWAAQKAKRSLSCVALHLAHGVDVRLFEGDELRRTQLVKDGPAAEALAQEWRASSLRLGWEESPPNDRAGAKAS